MTRAIKDFLWYKAGEEIKEEEKEHIPKWRELGLVELEEEVKKPSAKNTFDSADVNKDGKIDFHDVVEVAKKAVRGRGRTKKNKK